MLDLTPLGTFHTAIGLIAVVAGLIALVRDQATNGSKPLRFSR